ncbi:MAG: restriction endonuclease subunit S [Brevundimonas sp.]|nr:restriction endonuclease subunit S [Brevundimonas sp.]
MARGRKVAAVPDGPIEGLWELPDGWWWERLGSLGTWIGGGTPSKANAAFWTDGEIPWVSPKDMKVSHIDDAADYITHAALNASSAKLVPSGSVVLVMRSGILSHSLPVAVTRREVTLNQDLRALSPRDDVRADFVAHYLRSVAQAILHKCSKDGTTVSSIETERLMDWPVPMTALDVQDHVVQSIDRLFDELDEGEVALAQARDAMGVYRQAFLKAAHTGLLTAAWRASNPGYETGSMFLARIAGGRSSAGETRRRISRREQEQSGPEIDALPELPSGWVWTNLEQLTSVPPRNGLSIKEAEGPTAVRGLRLDALAQDHVDWSRTRYLPRTKDEVIQYLLQDGDLLVSRANGSPHLVGKASICEGTPEDVVFPDTAFRYRLGGPPSLKDWVLAQWSSLLVRAQIVARAKTTAGILKVSQGDLRKVAFPLPGQAEMEAALQLISEALSAAVNASGCIDATYAGPTLRQSILAAAFRGDLITESQA